MKTAEPLFLPSMMFQTCETPRWGNRPGRGAGIIGREVFHHHCGGVVGPTYRKPHFEASLRIARARKKYMMRAAPRMAATSKTSLRRNVTPAIVATSSPTSTRPSSEKCKTIRRPGGTFASSERSMSDEFSQTEDAEDRAEDQEKPARTWSRWSHVVAGVIFCLVYVPFRGHPWAWPVSVATSYSAFVFAIALGLSLDDYNDFFGDPRIPEYVATLLLPHALILTPITYLAYLWHNAIPLLPNWVTEVHRLSLWQLCGILPAWFVGTREGIWLSGKIKRRLREFQL